MPGGEGREHLLHFNHKICLRKKKREETIFARKGEKHLLDFNHKKNKTRENLLHFNQKIVSEKKERKHILPEEEKNTSWTLKY